MASRARRFSLGRFRPGGMPPLGTPPLARPPRHAIGPGTRGGEGTNMAGSLDGKVALVTGAGRNIGRAIALRLARDGAAVVVNGRADQAAVEAVAAEIRAVGGRAMTCLADVSDAAAVARMAAAVEAEWGGVDIAVSNAGLRRQTAFLDISLQ